jgi:hypothetical protein
MAWQTIPTASVLVAPARGRDWQDYEGCTLIKSNGMEAADADTLRDLHVGMFGYGD